MAPTLSRWDSMFSFPLCLLCGSVSSTSKWGMRSLFLYTLGTARPPKLEKKKEEKKNCWFFFTHPALEHKMYWSRFGRDESTGRMSSFSLALMSYTTSKLSFLSLDSTAPESFLSQAMWRTALE